MAQIKRYRILRRIIHGLHDLIIQRPKVQPVNGAMTKHIQNTSPKSTGVQFIKQQIWGMLV